MIFSNTPALFAGRFVGFLNLLELLNWVIKPLLKVMWAVQTEVVESLQAVAILKHCKARASNLYELSLHMRFSLSCEKTRKGNGLCKLSQIPAVNDI